jgi:hypothetical protein
MTDDNDSAMTFAEQVGDRSLTIPIIGDVLAKMGGIIDTLYDALSVIDRDERLAIGQRVLAECVIVNTMLDAANDLASPPEDPS